MSAYTEPMQVWCQWREPRLVCVERATTIVYHAGGQCDGAYCMMHAVNRLAQLEDEGRRETHAH